jgi:hypothetical protein
MSDPTKPKDGWDKFGVLLQPVGGLLTAMAVAFVGVTGSRVLEERQSRDSNSRLYSELMSRREEAESTLRKDVLGAILQEYLHASPTDLDAKVLQLELLSNNFHDSLDLRPLFHDLQRKLLQGQRPDRTELLGRIESLAREVTSKQLFTLQGRGARFTAPVDLAAVEAAGAGSVPLTPEPQTITIGNASCDVAVLVRAVDRETKTLRVRLETSSCRTADAGGAGTPSPEGTSSEGTATAENAAANASLNTTFDVGFFDFPIIDNTRLANGWRCAVVLTNWIEGYAELTALCFPGEYASLKDRPYYEEVIQKLREQ